VERNKIEKCIIFSVWETRDKEQNQVLKNGTLKNCCAFKTDKCYLVLIIRLYPIRRGQIG